jgi:glycosyltransferase involved in cell wall biosynthesis
MRRLRVVHITPALFGADGGVYGGAERYGLELARHMAEVVPTRLVSFADRPGRLAVGRLDVRLLGPCWHVRGQRLNPLHPGLVRAVAGADVVHCHQRFVLASELGALLARASGRRAFVSDLGGGGWCLASRLDSDRWFHGHLHISEYSRAVSRASGRVVYGGVDVERFSPDPSVPREPLVVFAGRLMPHKGVDTLIAALPDGLALELIGRPYDPRYLADLKRLAAGKPVRFRHDCDDRELVRAYRRAVCVVLPSVYRDLYGNETRVPELLGQTLLEGMACGTPVVCTAVASMPEVVTDGETGFVVPPYDPAALRAVLERLWAGPAEVTRLGRAGRRRVLDHFTWPAVVRRCLDAYAGGPGPAPRVPPRPT